MRKENWNHPYHSWARLFACARVLVKANTHKRRYANPNKLRAMRRNFNLLLEDLIQHSLWWDE